jgi:hypothetical protein
MEFVEFFRQLESYGFTDALLPFLLIFTILFAILQKSNILGAGKRNFNVVVAGSIALLTVMPHLTGQGPDVIKLMNAALPKMSIIAVAVIMALFLVGLFGGEAKWMGGSLSGWIALVAFGLVTYVFGAEAGWWQGLQQKFTWWGSETSSIVIIILVFAIVIWFITREPSAADKAGAFSNAFGKLGDMFKK